MTLLWVDDCASEAIGFDPPAGNPINGFQDATWEVYDGTGASNLDCHTDVQFAADGTTKGVRSRCGAWSPSASTQRAEMIPTNSSWSGQGSVFWRGFDLTFPTALSGSWGPVLAQWRRSGNGNGPLTFEWVSSNNHLYLLGASGYGPSGRAVTLPGSMGGGSATTSVVDCGVVPAPGDTLRIVVGIMLSNTNGWVEVWKGLNGAAVTQVGSRIQPWISNNTSTDNPPGNTVGSTTDVNSGSLVNPKYGVYRGSNASSISVIYSSLKHGTTKADVDTGGAGGTVGKAPSGGSPTNPDFTTSLSTPGTTMTMPPKPGGAVEGDLFFLCAYLERETTMTPPSRPSGFAWTSLGVLDDTPGTFRTQVWWSREDLAGTDWTGDTITWDGVSATHSAVCAVVRDGILIGDPQDATMTSNQGTGTTVTYTGLTTVNPNTLLLTYSQNNNNVDPTGQPSGFSSIVFGSAGMASYKVQASPGATGSFTQTMAAAPGSWHSHMIAVRAEPALNASFTVSPVSGEVGQPTVFDASASVGSITRMMWEFPSVGQDDSALAFTGVNSTDTFTRTSSGTHTYNNGDKVRVVTKTGGSSLSAQHYFVRDATSTTLKLAATSGGAAVDLGSDVSAISLLRVTFTWAWTSSGTKNITLTAFDAFGAEQTDSDTTIVTPTDTIAPVTTITNPGSGDDLSTPSVTATWTRNEANCTSEVKIDGGSYFSVGSATSYTATYAVGTHTIQVRSTDSSGNIEGTDPGPSGSATTPPSRSFNILDSGTQPTEWWGVLA